MIFVIINSVFAFSIVLNACNAAILPSVKGELEQTTATNTTPSTLGLTKENIAWNSETKNPEFASTAPSSRTAKDRVTWKLEINSSPKFRTVSTTPDPGKLENITSKLDINLKTDDSVSSFFSKAQMVDDHATTEQIQYKESSSSEPSGSTEPVKNPTQLLTSSISPRPKTTQVRATPEAGTSDVWSTQKQPDQNTPTYQPLLSSEIHTKDGATERPENYQTTEFETTAGEKVIIHPTDLSNDENLNESIAEYSTYSLPPIDEIIEEVIGFLNESIGSVETNSFDGQNDATSLKPTWVTEIQGMSFEQSESGKIGNVDLKKLELETDAGNGERTSSSELVTEPQKTTLDWGQQQLEIENSPSHDEVIQKDDNGITFVSDTQEGLPTFVHFAESFLNQSTEMSVFSSAFVGVDESNASDVDSIPVVGFDGVSVITDLANMTSLSDSVSNSTITDLEVGNIENAPDTVEPTCPPPGVCLFWFMAQDACAVHSHCLGSRMCCKIRCSKTCIDV